jgi:hypothetical protein
VPPDVTMSWSRRSTLGLAGGLAISALAGTHGRTTAVQATTDTAPITGEFVGAVPLGDGHHENEIFVAVVADPPADAAARRVRAYICDGLDVDEWFVGEIEGDSFTLSSEDGDAELSADLTDESVTGTFTLPGEAAREFEATRPAGKGGLYIVYIREDRTAFGASARGVAYFNEIVGDQGEGLFVLPNGETEAVTVPVIRYPPVGDVSCRLIVLDEANTHMRGGSVKKKDDGKSQFSWNMCLD